MCVGDPRLRNQFGQFRRRPGDRLDPVVDEEDLPSRMSFRWIAAAICLWSYGPTNVSTGSRSSGGVAMVEISRIPVTAISSVRGIGVADMLSTSTEVRSALTCSLCSTPNRCSSSTMSSPSSGMRVWC